jgi:hypothetical protein
VDIVPSDKVTRYGLRSWGPWKQKRGGFCLANGIQVIVSVVFIVREDQYGMLSGSGSKCASPDGRWDDADGRLGLGLVAEGASVRVPMS